MKYFTREQIEEIRRQLATLGVKDTDMPPVTEMTGDEIVAIVQDGINKTVGIRRLFRDFLPEDIAASITNGKSAYELWLELPGNAGKTIQQFFASLKGEKGEKGDTGATGATGPQGPAGSTVQWNQLVQQSDSTTKIAEVTIDGTTKGVYAPVGGDGITVIENPYTLEKASSSKLGGVMIGYPASPSSGECPLVLNASGKAYVVLRKAADGVLGGIKTGFTDQPDNRLFGVRTMSDGTAYVNVPGGEIIEGSSGGHWDQVFAAFDKDAPAPSVQNIPSTILDEVTDTWRHYAPNNVDQSKTIWMAVRWIPGSGIPESWQGPWCISGSDGINGTDGDRLEFIYTRTNDETSPTPSLASTTPEYNDASHGSTPLEPDFVPQGWKDNAMDPTIQIDATHRVMWMAYRIWSEVRNPSTGVVTSGWSAFVGPIPWSIWGKTGLDGDGVEYIFYTGSSYPVNEPDSWDPDTTAFQTTHEYIQSGSGWKDDPDDPEQGQTVWVSIRRKHEVNGVMKWGAYSSPTVWAYYPKDGDAGIGVVADFDNDTMAVAIKSNGYNYAFSETAEAVMYNGGPAVASNISSIVVKDTTGVDHTSSNWVTSAQTNGRNIVTVAIPEDAIDLSSKNLRISVTLVAAGNYLNAPLFSSSENYAANSIVFYNNALYRFTEAHSASAWAGTDAELYGTQRTIVLQVLGVNFGEDGESYRLVLNTAVIKKSGSGVIPSSGITPLLLHTYGSDATPTTTTPTDELGANNGAGSGFTFKYSVDNGTEVSMTGNVIGASILRNASSSIRVELDYNDALVDQETVLVVADGDSIPGESILTSTVFKRSASQPAQPGNGTSKYKYVNSVNGTVWSGSAIERPQNYIQQEDETYGGSFYDPEPYGWSDGIPALVTNGSDLANRLWSSTRRFSDTPGSLSQDDEWSTPSEVMDYPGYDVEFARERQDGLTPAAPVAGNRHGCNPSSNQVWFDPDLDSSVDFTNMFWKAERWWDVDHWGQWVITRIKGETGAPGGTGATGTPAFYAELTNEADGLAVGSDGILTESVDLHTVVKLFSGTTPQAISDIDMSIDGDYSGHISYIPNYATGEITVSISASQANPFDLTQVSKLEFPITVTGTLGSRELTYTIIVLKHGEDGSVYKLLPSADVIVGTYIDVNGQAQLQWSPSSITCSKVLYKPKKAPEVSNDGVLKYSFQQLPTNQYNASNTYDYPVSGGVPVSDIVSENSRTITFLWYYEGLIIDRETVPLIKDGSSETIAQVIKGKDALPIRIRDYAEVKRTAPNGLTGTDRVFSGYETNAPFRDVIIVTNADYGSGVTCPFTKTVNGQTEFVPALLVVNYSDLKPDGYDGTDLPLPSNLSDEPYNYTYNFPATEADSLALSQSNPSKLWSVFTNVGAIYASMLVATQAYIGSLTVDHLTTNAGNNSYIIIDDGFICFYDSNGNLRIKMGQESGDQTPVLKFFDASGNLLYDLGPDGIKWALQGSNYTDCGFGNRVGLGYICPLDGEPRKYQYGNGSDDYTHMLWALDPCAFADYFYEFVPASRYDGNGNKQFYNYDEYDASSSGHGWVNQSTINPYDGILVPTNQAKVERPAGAIGTMDVWPKISDSLLSVGVKPRPGWYLDNTNGFLTSYTGHCLPDPEDGGEDENGGEEGTEEGLAPGVDPGTSGNDDPGSGDEEYDGGQEE